MKGSTLIVGIIALIVGLVIGKFIIPSGEQPVTTASVEEATTQPAAPEQGLGPAIHWKMASSFPGEMVQLGDQGRMLEQRIREMSGGNMEVKFFEPNALVPPLEIFDAVSAGSVDAGWTAAGYWAGKVPALQIFSAIPFGPRAGEMLAWMYYGGGIQLYEELDKRFNVHPLPCNMISPEGSGWFRKEIKSVDDLKGLKMRIYGLGAKVIEKLGVSTQLLAGGDIFPALELGTIDATEFSMPAIDLDLGFYQIAKNYYFPGWHQPMSLGELIINLDRWNSLTDAQRAIIDGACKESMLRGFAQGEAIQFPALEELQKKGVTLRRWSPEILAALRKAWTEVVAEQTADNADFARVWKSLSDFDKGYKLWGDLGYLK